MFIFLQISENLMMSENVDQKGVIVRLFLYTAAMSTFLWFIMGNLISISKLYNISVMRNLYSRQKQLKYNFR